MVRSRDATDDVGAAGRSSSGADRIVGVDVARGVALLGMMAVHVFDTFGRDGAPTAATTIAGGRSAATFALVAGVSLAFLSGGRRVPVSRGRSAARAGIAVRAVLIGVIGLLLGHTSSGDVILVYYALLFVLALPLLGLRPRALFGIVAVAITVAPLLLVASFDGDLPSIAGGSPTVGTLIEDPAGLVLGLLLTGSYPAVAYLPFLAAGLAIGRLDLSADRVAARLLGGGLVLAIGSWTLSWILLFRLGGLVNLEDAAPSGLDGQQAQYRVLWDPDLTSSWWWLALRAPHSGSTIELVHTLGSAMAVLGAALLLSRIPLVARILRPVAAAGILTLTIYCTHLVVLSTGLLEHEPALLYVLLVVASLVLAPLWLRRRGRGPLEELVGRAAARARRYVVAGETEPQPETQA